MKNAMTRIDAYRDTLGWAFDDSRYGLRGEAFVMGASELIDYAIKISGKNSESVAEATLLFSANEFPGYHVHVSKIYNEYQGAWYQLENSDQKGWLCPATLHYFPEMPDHIYLKIESTKNNTLFSRIKNKIFSRRKVSRLIPVK